LVEDTVGECTTGTDGEEIALEAGAVGIYIEYGGALLKSLSTQRDARGRKNTNSFIPATDHGTLDQSRIRADT
jgi:hypothetical protein